MTRQLIKDLERIHTRDDLLVIAPSLERHFSELAFWMVASRHLQNSQTFELNEKDHMLSEALRVQINRVYQIEGGRQIIEKVQNSAVQKLNKP